MKDIRFNSHKEEEIEKYRFICLGDSEYELDLDDKNRIKIYNDESMIIQIDNMRNNNGEKLISLILELIEEDIFYVVEE